MSDASTAVVTKKMQDMKVSSPIRKKARIGCASWGSLRSYTDCLLWQFNNPKEKAICFVHEKGSVILAKEHVVGVMPERESGSIKVLLKSGNCIVFTGVKFNRGLDQRLRQGAASS